MVVYFGRLWGVLLALPSDPNARRFVLLGGRCVHLPRAIVGLLLHDFIKNVLFNSPVLICVVLIVGGVALAALDRYDVDPVNLDAMRFPLGVAFVIGLFQCLAIVPGVSRSGATIAGALLMKCDKRAAAEFSFFLAIPTMLGAFVLDFYENRGVLSGGDLGLILLGFVVAFVAALVVVRTFVDFVARHGFTPFAWWRAIVVGLSACSGFWLLALSASRSGRGADLGELAALAEAREIGRKHDLQRRRLDSEPVERALVALRVGRDDVVEAQHPDLVEGDRRARQKLTDRGRACGPRTRGRHQQPLPRCVTCSIRSMHWRNVSTSGPPSS